MKSYLQIGASTFGVEPESAELSVSDIEAGWKELYVEVEAAADQVSEDEEWNWSGLPPKFYLRGFPIPDFPIGSVHTFRVPTENYEVETAIYLGQHNDLTDVVVILTAWSSVKISGTVDAMGNVVPFQIELDLNDVLRSTRASPLTARLDHSA